MFLKRITIVGFKSFANKTVLDLEPGMTAVVGPNGSGKSNIADAIRWALGEQSKSRLRLGERDEVVFAGSDKRARASMAEVVLLFNNESGAFPLGTTEVEMSRRLYRSGETEYRLAGRPVKLGDLQQLLAEAGFGVGSYAVIGQGTIDSLLMSSPAERKLLFDEAAGIRGAELSREASVRKLAATEANLVRLRDITAELAPQAAALERAKVIADERHELARQVAGLRATIIATAEAQLSREETSVRTEGERLERVIHRLKHDLAALEHAQMEQLADAAKAEAAASEHHARITRLEAERDEATKTLGAAQALLAEAEHSGDGRTALTRRERALTAELETLATEQQETRDELSANRTSAKRASGAIEAATKLVVAAQAELLEIRQQLTDGTRQQYVGHALSLVKTMALQLDGPDANLAELKLLVHKTGRLLSHASRTGEAELVTDIKAAQAKLEAAMAKRETATEHQTNITLTGRSLELEQTRQEQEQAHLGQELALVRSQLAVADQSAAGLTDRRQAAKAAATELQTLTIALESARQGSLATVGAPAEAVARLAVELERHRSQLNAAQEQLRAASARSVQITHELTTYRRQAELWDVVAGEPDARRDLDTLGQQLVRLESDLAARTQLAEDQQTQSDQLVNRQQELTAQIADLEAAKIDLETMVAKLAGVVQERFKTNFERLSAEFSRQADRIFGGGQASLTLVEDETGQYGIQIKVSPKGKRLATLASLSGGERAMAGVALLAAILSVNPSPFVVLDEIDAALDDANSGRLADIMGELAAKSQLIVITHNRQTMKAARVLFGVTMNDAHVSHLLSLHLEQATELAAR